MARPEYTSRVTPANNTEPYGSRVDSYLRSDGAEVRGMALNWYTKFRTPQPRKIDRDDILPRLDVEVIKKYSLSTITFGNWVKNFDRLNFCAVLDYSLNDLQNIIGKPSKGLGLKRLTIDWGGRGKKGAYGLYYSGNDVINLRRYTRPDKLLNNLAELGQDTSKYITKYFVKTQGQHSGTNYELNGQGYVWILGSSGFGSFAHEFGHFIDAKLGKKINNPFGFVSGDGVLANIEGTEEEIKKAFGKTSTFEETVLWVIFRNLYYDVKKINRGLGVEQIYSPNENFKNLLRFIAKEQAKESYWCSFVELWARIFECYVQARLEDKGISNTFLVGDYKKFEVQVKVVDGKEITKEVGKLCYPTPSSIRKNYNNIKSFLDIFADI